MFKQNSRENIKKSDLFLGFLIIIFFVIFVTFLFDTALHESFLKGVDVPKSSIFDIKEHKMESISHFASNRSCATCHADAINDELICISLCHKVGGIASDHIPLLNWTGVNDSGTILFEHHPGGTLPFGCLFADCHENSAQPDDARYALNLLANHDFCDLCHEYGGHGNDSGLIMLGSHSIHTNNSIRGPETSLTCTDCHDVGNFSKFVDGQDLNNTTACNTCHSQGGRSDGVDNTSIGAKPNWPNGVYNETLGTLNVGMEKWCAGCHDNGSSVINGQTAYDVGLFWTSTKVTNGTVDCESCHYTESGTHINSSSSDPNLKGTYVEDTYWVTDPYDENTICWGCHDPDIYINGSAGTNFSSHKKHITNKGTACYGCHETHAETNFVHQLKVIPVTGPVTGINHYPAGGGQCQATCHGGSGWKTW
jgi:hypothetical protein